MGARADRDFTRTGALTTATAAEYTVLSRIYTGAMQGGSFFTGLALMMLGGLMLRTRAFSRVLGALSIVAGALDAVSVVVLLPPALPLTGVVLVWLGLGMWRGATRTVESCNCHES